MTGIYFDISSAIAQPLLIINCTCYYVISDAFLMYVRNQLFTDTPKMGIFAKSEESGVMPRSVALHLGLHSLLIQ